MRTSRLLLVTLSAFILLLVGCSNPQPGGQAPLSNPEEEVRDALAGVCAGLGVPEAAAYAGGGVHPVALVSSGGGSHDWSNDLPEAWVPQSVQDAQLVACVGEETEREIEECLYNGPSIHRYQYQVSAQLVEARTGARVASTVLEGSLPRECRSTEDYDLTRLAGDHVAFAAARDWMRGYVEGGVPSEVSPAEPAVEPPAEPGSQPSIEVSVFCGYFGESPVTIGSGQRVVLYWKWGAASDDYLQDYVDAASFALLFDGAYLDLADATQSWEDCEGGRCVIWRLPPMTLQPGPHEAVITVTLDREITDGFDLDNNGALDLYGPSLWEAPACQIIVE